jgi:hypothetical protein
VRRGLLIRIECTEECAIRAALYASRLRVGRARGSLAHAGTTQLRVKLTPKAKRRLRRTRRVSLTLRVSVKGPGGSKSVTSRKVRMRR